MFNRKKLDRERLEIYLVHLLLAYRRWIVLCGVILLLYAVAITIVSPLIGGLLAIIAALPLLVGFSYRALVLTARLGAWIGTVWRKE